MVWQWGALKCQVHYWVADYDVLVSRILGHAARVNEIDPEVHNH